MRCTTAREQLQRQIVGNRLLPVRAMAMLAHLARCKQCRQEWQRLQLLRRTARNLPSPSLPIDLGARVLAEIATMPTPISAGETPTDARKRRATRMIQRTLILGVCLAATITPLILLTPRHHGNGAVVALADVRKAVEQVNTWHLKGWKSEGDKEIPWEVWGRRSPFFYHERIGGQETLDDGKERTIVFPANTSYGNKQAVVLKIPSRPSTQSSMGLSFVLGLDRQSGNNNNKPWSQDGDTETFIREEMIIGSEPAIEVNGLFTFEKGSSLPVRYERLMRMFHTTKNADGATIMEYSDSAKVKEWTGAHLDAQYNLDLDAAAFHIAAPADARQIDAVSDATAPSMPNRDAATQNGLTLHLTKGYVDAKGDVLICLEGFVGSVNFKGSHLPFGFDTAVRSGMIQDRMGNYQNTGYPESIVAHDERGRAYVAVTNLEFLRYTGERAWLALAPLEPLRQGTVPPHQMSFLMEMSLTTTQPLPEVQSNVAINLLQELLPLEVQLPTTYAEMDLKALSKQYGTAENIEQRGFVTRFEIAAAEARADAWQNMAREALQKSITYQQAGPQAKPVRSVDPAKWHEAEQTLQSAVHYAQEASKQISPDSAARLKSNLEGLKKWFHEQSPKTP